MFRVGIGDEPLTRRGYTHLIEHLTLHDIRNPRLQWNGFVDLNRTVFHATGDQSDVEEFLLTVSRRLHDFPEERLLAERQVLAAEARSRGMSVGSELLSRRFGATGWGSAGWWEMGIPYAEPGDLTDWMRRGFGRRNAVMWMTCPPSGSLLLDLPDGSSLQLPSTTVAANGRAWFRFRSSAVAFLIRAQRSYPATLAANVLTSELHRRLRDAGLCYSVSNNWSRLTPDLAAFTVSCDSVPDRETQLAEAVLTIVDNLADRPPDEALATVRSGRTLAQPDDVTRTFLDAFAHDHLLGRPRQTISSHLAEEDAVAIDDVAREIRKFRDDLLMAVPEQAIVRRADMPTYPDPPPVEVGGKRRRYATFFERSDSSGYLAVDSNGLAIGHASGVNAVRWNDVNCVMRWDDGTRCAISHRGDSVLVEPTRFVDGVAAIDVIDASVPDEASVRIGHRYGAPVVPWAPKRSTTALRVARWLISWVLLVTTYVLAVEGPWLGAGAVAPFCALLWWSIRTTSRPSPHIWDNSNTRRDVPETVDRSAWYVPTGLLFGWLIERDHLTPHWRAALAAEVDEVASRSLTGPSAYRRAGGILTDDMLTAEANEFLSDFLEHVTAGRRLSTSNVFEAPHRVRTGTRSPTRGRRRMRSMRKLMRASVTGAGTGGGACSAISGVRSASPRVAGGDSRRATGPVRWFSDGGIDVGAIPAATARGRQGHGRHYADSMIHRRWSVCALVVATVALTAGCDPNRYVAGWIPHWTSSGTSALDGEQDKLFSEVSLMWFEVNNDGAVVPLASLTTMHTVRDRIHDEGLPVLPSIFDGADPGRTRGLLADPARRAAHVQAITNLVVAQGVDGIDLDYEVFAFGDGRATWPSITPNWVAFVGELSGSLRNVGKLLSVTIPPVWQNSTGAVQGYTVYAQEQIAPFVDRLRLMVYDWSVLTPGPIAPIAWVNQVIAYSSPRVPASKLQLGVPAYGRHWTTKKFVNETCPDGSTRRASVTMKQMGALAASVGQTPVRDVSGELTFSWTQVVTGTQSQPPPYTPPPDRIERLESTGNATAAQPAVRLGSTRTVSCTLQHTVFVPDGVSLRQRADAALAANWSGIVVWALGYETPDVYSALAGADPQRPNGAPTGVFDPPSAAAGVVRATGYAVDPEFDLPVAVRVRVLSGNTTVQTRKVTANRERGGLAEGLGPYHGFDESITVPAGGYSVCVDVVLWDGVAGPSLGCQNVTVP